MPNQISSPERIINIIKSSPLQLIRTSHSLAEYFNSRHCVPLPSQDQGKRGSLRTKDTLSGRQLGMHCVHPQQPG